MPDEATTTLAPVDPLVGLMRQVGRGHEDAFRDLYRLTREQVFEAANRTLRAPDHSEEVVQDVFVHVWQRAASFDPARGSVLGWLGMLAHRRAVDRVRRVSRSVLRDHLHAASASTVRDDDRLADDVCQLAHDADRAASLGHALQRLTACQREAITLTYLRGHTQVQAAGILQVPLGTLKTRVRDGLSSLRRHVGDGTLAA